MGEEGCLVKSTNISGSATRPFRIMSFDGGGVHAASYLPVISDLEQHLAARVVESKHVRLLVGTSTGTIVAVAIALGVPAREIEGMYAKTATQVFRKARIWNWPFYRYRSVQLRETLAAFYGTIPTVSRDITWRRLSQLVAASDIELVVTLWDVIRERSTFLSTNLARPGQAEDLWDATLADIVTACCAAPVFFPARWFQRDQTRSIYCDGGITGLNNPAAFGVSLVYNTIAHDDGEIQVISFGSGESALSKAAGDGGAQPEDPNAEAASPTVEDSLKTMERLRNRSVIELAPAAIDALMISTARFMDHFYSAFGGSLGITRYLRTNQVRSPDSKLDDAAAIPILLAQFTSGEIYFDLWSHDQRGVSKERCRPGSNELQIWRDIWSSAFGMAAGYASASALIGAEHPQQASSAAPSSESPQPTDSGQPAPPTVTAMAAEQSRTISTSSGQPKHMIGPESGTTGPESGETLPTLLAVLTAPTALLIAAAVVVLAALGSVGYFIANNARQLAEHQARLTELDRIVSKYVSDGDSHLAAGDPVTALAYYRAGVSQEVNANLFDHGRVEADKLRITRLLPNLPRLVNQTIMPGDALGVRVIPDGKRLVIALKHKAAHELDLGSNSISELKLICPSAGVMSPSTVSSDFMSADGRLIIHEGSFIGDPLRVWTRDPDEPSFATKLHNTDFIRFSDDGKYLALAATLYTTENQTETTHHAVWIWDCQSRQQVAGPLEIHQPIGGLQFSRDGKLLIMAGVGFNAPLPATEAMQPQNIEEFATVWSWREKRHKSYRGYNDATISPNGRLLAVSRVDGGVDIYDTKAGNVALHLAGPTTRVPSALVQQLLFTRNDEWLVHLYSSEELGIQRISAWQIAAGDGGLSVGQPVGHDIQQELSIEFARLSPDGTKLLVVSNFHSGLATAVRRLQVDPVKYRRPEGENPPQRDTHRVQVFNLATGQPACPPLPSNDEITIAEFCPESRRVIVVSKDRLLKVWDLAPILGAATTVNLDNIDKEPYLRALSGLDVDANGNSQPLSTQVSQTLWEQGRGGDQPWRTVSDAEQITWHEQVHNANLAWPHIGGPARGLSHAEQLVSLEPKIGKWHMALGIDQNGLSQWTAALASLDRASKLGVDDPELHLARARGLIELGRLSEADAALQSASKKNAVPWRVSDLRRELAGRQEHWQTVIDDVTAIPDNDLRRNILALADRGWAYAELGAFDKARLDLAEVARQWPGIDETAQYALAALAAGNEELYADACDKLIRTMHDRAVPPLLTPIEDLRQVVWTCSAAPNHIFENDDSVGSLTAFVANLAKLDDTIPTRIAIAQFMVRREMTDDLDKVLNQTGQAATVTEQAFRATLLAIAGKSTASKPRQQELLENARRLTKAALELPTTQLRWRERSQLKRLLLECAGGPPTKERPGSTNAIR